MPARTPEEVHELWAELFSAGDVDGLVDLYEPDAIIAPRPGRAVAGYTALREVLESFIAPEAKFDLKLLGALQCGDIALLYSRWTLMGRRPDGRDVNVRGLTSDVVRRQVDGSWRFVIDNPYGCEGIADAAP